MKSKSRRNISIIITLSVCFLSFASVGSAVTANSSVNFRSIDDWLGNNPGGSGNFINDEYALNPGNPFNLPILQPEIFLVNGETTYEGYVREKVLSEDRTEVFVILQIKNAPLTIYSFPEFRSYIFWLFGMGPEVPPPTAILGKDADGYIDYSFKLKFILPGPNLELPSFGVIYNQYEVISLKLTGTGYGTFTDSGEEGMVFVNQLMLSKPQLEDHEINKLYDTELWPVEIINVK